MISTARAGAQVVVVCPGEICRDLAASSSREWLETNGLGGFAMATVTGMHTRRYHGLLVAATKPPVGRVVLLSKLEETLLVGEKRIDLSTNRFPGTIHPRGLELLKEFRIDPFPTWIFEAEGVTIEKRVFMVSGENTTVVEYTSGNARPGTRLELRPLVAFRADHALSHENDLFDRRIAAEPGVLTLRPYAALPTLHIAHTANEVGSDGTWYRSFEYEKERQRGFDFTEDLFNPFTLAFDLTGMKTATVIASTERRDSSGAALLRKVEGERRQQLVQGRAPGGSAPLRKEDIAGAAGGHLARASFPPSSTSLRKSAPAPSGSQNEAFLRALFRAADQFLVARGDVTTVIAGYPWFSDWGRDTMIALPGLMLATGRADAAKSILRAFAGFVDRGMLPNRFPDAGEGPEYNTVDATLWFFEAVRRVHEATGDDAFVKKALYDVLANIVDWHERGTRYGIRVDTDGLLLSGEEGVQLTWMDAKVGDWVVTPRRGKPVEIQALWYNSLKIMEGFARRFRRDADAARFSSMAARAAAGFGRLFWNEAAGCLYDVVDGETRDGSIRPNQVFAISLPFTMLDRATAARSLDVVTRELLTPYGLRTLSPKDPAYRGRYEGDGPARDAAYHQGTVWPWLIGPYISAFLRVNGSTAKVKKEAAELLGPLRDFLLGEGLGQLPEIFDGDAPRGPRGCVAQAWSIGEVLRALVELE